jgi:DnaK suppressor protein
MGNKEIDNLKELLVKLKNELILSGDCGVSECIRSEKSADDLDNAVADNHAALSTKLYARQAAYLKRIDESLQKIEEGTYGECLSCGDIISYKRLFARPTAHLCISCKEEQEMEEQKEKDKLKGGFLADWD